MTEPAHWSVPGAIDEAMAAHNALSLVSRELLHHVCTFGMDLFAANCRLARELAAAKRPLLEALDVYRHRFKRTPWGDQVAQAPLRGAACIWFDALKPGELEILQALEAKGNYGPEDEEYAEARALPRELVTPAGEHPLGSKSDPRIYVTPIGRLVLEIAQAGHRGTQ